MASKAAQKEAEKAKQARVFLRSKLARTRGPDPEYPVNKSNLVPIPLSKRRRGAKPVYAQQLVDDAKHMAAAGATDFEIIEELGIHRNTYYRWRHEHPEFAEAVANAKEAIDERAERSLYERAVGYTYRSEKIFQNDGSVIRAPVVEHVPPDVGALTLWLKNRQPHKWRDRKEIDLSGEVVVSDAGSREVALALIQLLREAGNDDNAIPTIEHREAEPAPERKRRSFE